MRNLLSPEEVATFNTIVDANADRAHDAGPPDDYLTGTPMEGQHGAFVQYTDVLRWPEGQCQPFRELMVHPNLRPVLNTIFGRGWRIETEEVHDPSSLTAQALLSASLRCLACGCRC